MGRGQHGLVIEPPKRTAHNLAYAAERLVELALYTAAMLLVLWARPLPTVSFLLVALGAFVIVIVTPHVVAGRFTTWASRRWPVK